MSSFYGKRSGKRRLDGNITSQEQSRRSLQPTYKQGMSLRDLSASPVSTFQSNLMDFYFDEAPDESGALIEENIIIPGSSVSLSVGSSSSISDSASSSYCTPQCTPVTGETVHSTLTQVTTSGPHSRLNYRTDFTALLQQQATIETILCNQKSMEQKQLQMESKILDLEKMISSPPSSSTSSKSSQSHNGKRKQVVSRDLSVSFF